jgi:hypothetical protein
MAVVQPEPWLRALITTNINNNNNNNNLTNHIYLVSRLIINGSVPPIEHTSSGRAMGQLRLHYNTPIFSAINIVVK